MRLKDFQPGEDVTDEIERSKDLGIVVSARFNMVEAKRLVSLAEDSGLTLSQFIRRLVKDYRPSRPQVGELTAGLTGPGTLTVHSKLHGPLTRGGQVEILSSTVT